MCKSNLFAVKWLTEKQLPNDKLEQFKDGLIEKDTSCNTNKDNVFSCPLKCKTVGVQIASCNCGIIQSWKEMYGSESLAQVALFLTEINEQFIQLKISFCNTVIYDNGCNLAKYCHKRANDSIRTEFFKMTTFIVDRLHIQGHVGQWCLNNCHPKLFPELDGYNTQVCEQCNSWLSKFKYILKQMSSYRFNFYLYIIFNEYNLIKVNKKFVVHDSSTFDYTKGQKRKFHQMDDDTSEESINSN